MFNKNTVSVFHAQKKKMICKRAKVKGNILHIDVDQKCSISSFSRGYDGYVILDIFCNIIPHGKGVLWKRYNERPTNIKMIDGLYYNSSRKRLECNVIFDHGVQTHGPKLSINRSFIKVQYFISEKYDIEGIDF